MVTLMKLYFKYGYIGNTLPIDKNIHIHIFLNILYQKT